MNIEGFYIAATTFGVCFLGAIAVTLICILFEVIKRK